MANLTTIFSYIYSRIKQSFEDEEEDQYNDLIFKIRFIIFIICCLANLIIPIFNEKYEVELVIIEILMQIIHCYLLFSHKSIYIIAASTQVILLTPLFYLSFNVNNIFKIPVVALALIVIYCLQFFPVFVNCIFATLAFLVVDNSRHKASASFRAQNDFVQLLTLASTSWPTIAFLIFLAVNLFQYCNDKVWKNYSTAKKALKQKNQEQQLANDQMTAMVKKLEITNTRLEILNQALEEALQAQDLFVACVSHELRNPLNAIMGNIEILKLDIEDPNKKKMLKTCQVCGEMLLVLINNILDVSKINSEKLEISPSNVSIYTLLNKIWGVSRVGTLQNGLYQKLKVSRKVPLWIRADSHRLIQIFLNLLSNAAKFTSEGGIQVTIDWEEAQNPTPRTLRGNVANQQKRSSLSMSLPEEDLSIGEKCPGEKTERIILSLPRVKTRFHLMSELIEDEFILFNEHDQDLEILKTKLSLQVGKTGYLKVAIQDTGCGIAPEIQDKLFKPFVQADASITRKYGGTGLGLYIVKQLIEKMNGNITLQSKPGFGTKFKFKIPLSTVSEEVAKSLAGEAGGKSSLKSRTIAMRKQAPARALIVDDSAYNQEILKSFCKNLSVQTETADNGLEALEKVQSHPLNYYSFITMDLQMPIMDGITATKKIRQHEKKVGGEEGQKKEIPIIVVTGNCSLSEQEECINPAGEARATYFFRKPFQFADCKQCVDNILNQNHKGGQQKAKILIVDDDSFNRQVIQNQIERLGLVCEASSNGSGAVKKLKEDPWFTVIIMDYEMPDMNGVEATIKIRKELKLNQVYIIGVTGNTGNGTTKKMIQSGMNMVISKPVSLDQIFSLFKDLKVVE